VATRTQSERLECATARVLAANAPACHPIRAAPPPLAGARLSTTTRPVLKLPSSEAPSSGAYLPVPQAPNPLPLILAMPVMPVVVPVDWHTRQRSAPLPLSLGVYPPGPGPPTWRARARLPGARCGAP
jgi:hypothetical protein